MRVPVLLPAAGLLLAFLGCTESNVGSHLFSQPFSQDRYFFKGRLVDPSGNPVPGADVDIRFLLLAQDQATPYPKAQLIYPYSIFTTKEIYDLFGNLVDVCSAAVDCNSGPCPAGDPVWDGKDNLGQSVPRGLYRVRKQDVYWELVSGRDSTVVSESWTLQEGLLGTTDADGGFTIPALPWDPVPVQNGGGPIGYFKGWVKLTFSKTGYITHADTADVFAGLPDFVISP